MEKASGYVDHIVYRNEENGYTVLVLSLTGKKELTCVGTFPSVSQGLYLEAEGEMTTHPVYGKQLQVRTYEEKLPQDKDAIERYLASGAIKGIGPALAARIVRRFGEDTMRMLEEEPAQLAQIKGISAKKADEIGQQAAEKILMRRAMVFLQKYGISLNLGVKIYQHYGESLYRVIQENPYKMAEDIRGVGFLTADEIASRIGIHVDSDFRIRSGLLYCLSLAQGEGHVYLPREELFTRAARLLGVDPSYMEKHLMDMMLDRKVVLREIGDLTAVYPSHMYYQEKNTARHLLELNVRHPADPAHLDRRIRDLEEETGMRLDPIQKKAVEEAVGSGVFILTGGPGTGKTTTINSIIRYFKAEGAEIFLAAPTGRAAKRMTEATGREAKTIHRMLELTGMPDEEDADAPVHFERNEEHPLEADVVIIDEMSMVDISLMHSLIQAVSIGTRLILVGDENQLPSVGPGNVLRDMIRCGAFPVVELTRIFRQASQSDIVVNAHRILAGEAVPLDNKSRDFFFLKRADADTVISVTLKLIRDKLPSYVGASSFEIQVLTPMKKGQLGVERLNQVLQYYLNPPSEKKREHENGGRILREGDKVMQIRNNYQKEWEIRGRYGIPVDEGIGVFNGDMGILREINDFAQTMTVEFEEGRFAEYSFKELEELELAYAVTIHKSQGSEYPAVVMPLLSGPQMLLSRNLLYTAVTRAKKCVTIVGSDQTFARMIANDRPLGRYSSLDLCIRELAP